MKPQEIADEIAQANQTKADKYTGSTNLMGVDKDLGRVLMVGAGQMGGALIQSWLEKQTTKPTDIVLIEPNVARAKYFRDSYHLYTFEAPEAINT